MTIWKILYMIQLPSPLWLWGMSIEFHLPRPPFLLRRAPPASFCNKSNYKKFVSTLCDMIYDIWYEISISYPILWCSISILEQRHQAIPVRKSWTDLKPMKVWVVFVGDALLDWVYLMYGTITKNTKDAFKGIFFLKYGER